MSRRRKMYFVFFKRENSSNGYVCSKTILQSVLHFDKNFYNIITYFCEVYWENYLHTLFYLTK